jgi:hypothetical protein
MKKIFLFISFIALSVSSCSDDITSLNDDTKSPTTTRAEFLFTNAQKNLVDQMVSTSVNVNVFRLFSQYWTETTYPDESQYDIATRAIPDTHFRVLYRDVLRDLQEAKKLLDAEKAGIPATATTELAVVNNKIAIVDILMSYSYSVLVDTFGDVPYSESLDIEGHPLPKYDDAKTIYKDLISRLTADNNLLTAGDDSFGDADLIYGGNAASWKKFANSLRLRMAINMADVDAAYAAQEVIAAVNAGVLASNADNTDLAYLGAQPNANPLYADLVVSGRNDFVPANTFVDKMNALSDPRRAKYFTEFNGGYSGGIYGTNNNYNNFSHISETLADPTFAGTIMDYAEVRFLLAEAAARGIAITGTAEEHYNAAITASMENWGVDAADVATYLDRTDVSWATATGNWKQKIGEQAWIALYNRGFEGWSSYRRLDYPILAAPAEADITQVPTRYTYPSREETLNGTNVEAAGTAIGGNTLTTKIFWDVN